MFICSITILLSSIAIVRQRQRQRDANQPIRQIRIDIAAHRYHCWLSDWLSIGNGLPSSLRATRNAKLKIVFFFFHILLVRHMEWQRDFFFSFFRVLSRQIPVLWLTNFETTHRAGGIECKIEQIEFLGMCLCVCVTGQRLSGGESGKCNHMRFSHIPHW